MLHSPVALQVNLVADNRQDDLGAQHCLKFTHPVFDLLERVLVRYIVHQNGAVRRPVVDGAQRVKALLPSRVPDAQIDAPLVQRDLFVQERGLRRQRGEKYESVLRVGSHGNACTHLDRSDVLGIENVLNVAQHQRGFAHTSFAQ